MSSSLRNAVTTRKRPLDPTAKSLMETVASLHSAVVNQKTDQIPLLVRRAVRLLPRSTRARACALS